MSILLFLAALIGIVLFALIVNRLTGTRASYVEGLVLEAGELEAWRDTGADFAIRTRSGQAVSLSFPRLRRHTVVWTNRRVVIAQQVLLSSKRMITHQIVFEPSSDSATRAAADAFAGGFYGRGFVTLIAKSHSFTQLNQKECLCILPTEDSGSLLNIEQAYRFQRSAR